MTDDQFAKVLGQRMRALRLARWPKQSQREFARVIRVGASQILRWERGESIPRLPQLMRYAEACGTSASEMLSEFSRKRISVQLPLGFDLDPPARAVVVRLVDLLRNREQTPQPRRARRA